MLRRMVKRVASPTREAPRSADPGPSSQSPDAEKAELKAMIERKRRNDFVRKRELDMLRRIRREGLTPEQAQALQATSRLDEPDSRPTQPPGLQERDVTAKIDAIEKQMVGAGQAPGAPRPVLPARPAAPPPLLTQRLQDQAPTVPVALVVDHFPSTEAMPLGMPATAPGKGPAVLRPPAAWPPQDKPLPAAPPPVWPQPPAAPLPPPAAAASGPLAWEPPAPLAPSPTAGVADVEVNELPHDHELDEAVMAFAQADFVHCERALVQMTSTGGLREHAPDAWLALFDLYRATGQQARFEALAPAYSERFGMSPPQWFSLPRLVAQATLGQAGRGGGEPTQIGWVCPEVLDGEAVAQLHSQTLQLPLPWVLDWSRLQRVQADAALRLRLLMRQWAQQELRMRWLSADSLFNALQEAAPVGVRDADPAFWLARLEALRLANRPDQFDEVAIDYCVTYEVSPPSWETSRCLARLGESGLNTLTAALSIVGDAVTSLLADPAGVQPIPVTTLELSGQLAGDIAPVLQGLDDKLGGARIVRVSCALLIRVDFVAAGDLLNWAMRKRHEQRELAFVDVHRLVALMFVAMGITEQAGVRLRQA